MIKLLGLLGPFPAASHAVGIMAVISIHLDTAIILPKDLRITKE
jgi:hypothetical protein